MTEKPYASAHISEVGSQPGAEGSTWITIRRHFDVGAFGVNAYRVDEAGARVIEDHDETGAGAGRHEELYLVTNGRARFTVAGEEIDAPAGTFVFVRDPAARRTAFAEEPGTTVLVVGGKRGEPYQVSPWEEFAAAWPHYQAKDYEKAIEVFRAVLEKYPDNPSGLYNLACCESLAGDRAAALEHLGKAVELDGTFREHARSDSDFEAIRGDPRFAELTGA